MATICAISRGSLGLQSNKYGFKIERFVVYQRKSLNYTSTIYKKPTIKYYRLLCNNGRYFKYKKAYNRERNRL